MRLIAIEEHFLTSAVRAAWAASTEADAPMQGLHRGAIEDRLDDLDERRLRDMDEAGVDVQVLSLTTPGLHDVDGAKSVALAQRTNDVAATIVAGRPDRFQGLAALPTPAPKEAPRELERCLRRLGFKGAMLCGRTGEKNLDHQDFWPIFECAAALGAPLFIHPQAPPRAVAERYYSGFGEAVDLAFSTYGLGWHYEAGVQFVRLVLAGLFDRFPDLQIILGHWGEVILFYVERLASLDRAAKLERPFVEYVRQNLYVTASGMFSPAYMNRSIEIIGIDRILFSTDYPYQYRIGGEARRFLDRTGLHEEGNAKFAHANWERLIASLPTIAA